MTASNSKSTNADKNLNKITATSTAETRRASKPLMEKRRRARINQSLAILKNLIVDSQRIEGQKHSKLEKADILEMTVSHLQSVKKSDEQKFMEGFEECCSETIQFLEKSKINSSIVDKLADHLKHFQQNVDPSSLPKQNRSSITSPSMDMGTTSIEEEPGRLMPFSISVNVSEQGDSNSCPFSLNVPRFQLDNTNKAAGSSQSSCLSPALSMSNDSNNNPFVNEMESCQSNPVLFNTTDNGPSLQFNMTNQSCKVEILQQVLSQPRLDSVVMSDSQVLNLSTCKSYAFENSRKQNEIFDASQTTKDESMMMENTYNEPLDFSKPLNLCKHPVGYRLSEDGVWRPW